MSIHCILLVLILSYFTSPLPFSFSFFFNDTATTEIYTLSLHDALPISDAVDGSGRGRACTQGAGRARSPRRLGCRRDRKSTRLNSSHQIISYAVFCLKKKKKKHQKKHNKHEHKLLKRLTDMYRVTLRIT